MSKIILLSLLIFCQYSLATEIWYRPIKIDEWVQSGAEQQELKKVLKVIYDTNLFTAQSLKDSQVDLTISQYAQGNWFYEWNNLAQTISKQNNSKQYLAISQYFAISMIGTNTLIVDKNKLLSAYENSFEFYKKALEQENIKIINGSVNNRNDNFRYLIHQNASTEKPTKILILIADPLHIATQYSYFIKEFLKLYSGYAIMTVDLFDAKNSVFLKEDNFFARLDRIIGVLSSEKPLNSIKEIILTGPALISNQLITGYTNTNYVIKRKNDIKGLISICGLNHYPYTKSGFTELSKIEKNTLNKYFGISSGDQYSSTLLSKSIMENKQINKNTDLFILNLFDTKFSLYKKDAELMKIGFTNVSNKGATYSNSSCLDTHTFSELVKWLQ